MTKTALDQAMSRDREMAIARQSADQICYLLQSFIPSACFREARDTLADALHKTSTELTSSDARRRYEELQRHIILTTANPPLIPKD